MRNLFNPDFFYLGHDPDIRVSPSFTQDIDFKFINDAFYEARLLKQLLENARQKFDRKHLHDQIRETRERQEPCFIEY